MRFKPISATLIVIALLPLPALADDTTDKVSACDLAAWTTDTDPNGLNVRSGPGTGFDVIATLSAPVEDFFPEVHITGSQNGWFRIDSALSNLYDFGDVEAEPVTDFEGVGWVSGHYLGLLLNDMKFYSEPSRDSKLVATLFNDAGDGPDSFMVDRMISCTGNWVEVEGEFANAHYTGWATYTCSNQVTTCP